MPILHQCLLWTIAAGLVLSASPASGLASPIVRRMSKSLRHCNITLNGEGGRPFTHRFAKDEILLPVEAKWISQYITMMERGFAGIFQKVTDGCLTDHKDKVVLDIGANRGIYGIWAASKGCRAVLFEPQPTCHSSIRTGICLNAPYKHAPVLVTHPVLPNPEDTISIPSDTDCSGSFSLATDDGSVENSTKPAAPSGSVHTVSGVDVLSMLGNTQVAFMKIDVEGGELGVIQHLLPLFRARQIDMAIIEVTRPFYDKQGRTFADVWPVMKQIYDAGYTNINAVECNRQRLPNILDYSGQPLTQPGDLENFFRTWKWGQCDLQFQLPPQVDAMGLESAMRPIHLGKLFH